MPEDIGKCLLTIAKHFVMLEDYDNALPLYEEAYQLAVEHEFVDLRKSSGIMLIKYLCEAGYYSKSLEYYNQISQEMTSNSSVQNEIVKNYMELNKPDNARIYLSKRLLSEEGSNKIVLNCMMAETYISEGKEDSASAFLDRAMKAYNEKCNYYQRKGKNVVVLLFVVLLVVILLLLAFFLSFWILVLFFVVFFVVTFGFLPSGT